MRPLSVWQSAVAAAVVLTAASLRADEPAAPADAAALQRYSLRYKFAGDQVLHYAVKDESTIEGQVGQIRESAQSESTSTKQYRVTAVDSAGVADIEVTIVRVRLVARSQGEVLEYDSDRQDAAPGAFAALRNTIGKPLGTVRVSPLGKVVDVELAATGGAAAQLKDLHLDFLPLLPEQPVAVGESWTEEFSIDAAIEDPPFKLPINMRRLYTLRAVENDVARIDEQTICLTPLRDPTLEGQLIRRTPTGSFTIDLQRGCLVARELKIDKKVVGFRGPQTSLHEQRTREDRLVPEEQAARQPADAAATK